MTDELKSCPFCGGKAELHRPSIAVYAICSKCGISTSYIYPPEEAVRRWNNRSAEDALNLIGTKADFCADECEYGPDATSFRLIADDAKRALKGTEQEVE